MTPLNVGIRNSQTERAMLNTPNGVRNARNEPQNATENQGTTKSPTTIWTGGTKHADKWKPGDIVIGYGPDPNRLLICVVMDDGEGLREISDVKL